MSVCFHRCHGAWLTGHQQQQSGAAVVPHPDEAGVAAFIRHHHAAQQERGVAQAQLDGPQAGTVGKSLGLVYQLVAPPPVPVHTAFGVRQLPEDAQIGQVKGTDGTEGAVENGIAAVQHHHWLLRDVHFQHSCKEKRRTYEEWQHNY